MLVNKKEIKICWIHKIAMKEIPKTKKSKEKEYKCPVCFTTMKEE